MCRSFTFNRGHSSRSKRSTRSYPGPRHISHSHGVWAISAAVEICPIKSSTTPEIRGHVRVRSVRDSCVTMNDLCHCRHTVNTCILSLQTHSPLFQLRFTTVSDVERLHQCQARSSCRRCYPVKLCTDCIHGTGRTIKRKLTCASSPPPHSVVAPSLDRCHNTTQILLHTQSHKYIIIENIIK